MKSVTDLFFRGMHAIMTPAAMMTLVCLAVLATNGVESEADEEKANVPKTGESESGRMVLIPAGWFEMGCVPGDLECEDREKPRKRVYVNAFYMDVHEVTVAEYRECVKAGKCETAKESDSGKYAAYNNWDKPGHENHPINSVNWHEALTYCTWRGKRLPTEAEFEKALRGGAEGKKYPWGDAAVPSSRFGNYADESARRRFPEWNRAISGYDDGYVGTSPACAMEKNAYGLCDISGNVWEWCADWYEEDWYSRMPERNPKNDTPSPTRVLRGCGWNNFTRLLRASYRFSSKPSARSPNGGFRCARD